MFGTRKLTEKELLSRFTCSIKINYSIPLMQHDLVYSGIQRYRCSSSNFRRFFEHNVTKCTVNGLKSTVRSSKEFARLKNL